ncbi:hypothetical protein FACS1894124_4580 [Spirochaetia bacterium]|nr:hypothetical protein FACS1894124_4580 [Spirochaetia bacterium]
MIIDKSIAIAILARDCEKSLANNIPKIEQLRTYFKSSSVIVIENDSIDRTKEILKTWEKQAQNVIVISEDYHTQTIPIKTAECPFPGGSKHRMDKMCMYRNKYMEYLGKNKIECDYLIVMDIDVDDFAVEGVVKAINYAPSNWTALFANGFRYLNLLRKIRIKLKYYDAYPLILSSKDDDKIIIGQTFREVVENADRVSRQLRRKKYIRCVSAFGGIGIYKYEHIQNKQYFTIPNNRSSNFEVLCDHVSLNYSLYKEMPGTSYISSEMMVFYERIRSVKLFILQIMSFKLQKIVYEILKRKKFPV